MKLKKVNYNYFYYTTEDEKLIRFNKNKKIYEYFSINKWIEIERIIDENIIEFEDKNIKNIN